MFMRVKISIVVKAISIKAWRGKVVVLLLARSKKARLEFNTL